MHMLTNASFFHDMGRYAPYVWGAYGFAGAVLALMLAAAVRLSRRARRSLHGLSG